jgi:large subunit ribosomal protein L17
MRHRVHGRKLGRTTAHRKALFRNQLTALFTHERIITTLEKAKELRPVAERMVTLARTGTLPARRRILQVVPDKEIVRRLFDEIAPRFMERPGGYTRILRLGRRRGDNARMALIELVDFELEERDEGGSQEKKQSLMDRAKSMFGGGAGGADEAAPEETTVEAAAAEESVDEPAESVETAGAEEADTAAEEAGAEETGAEEAEEQTDEDEKKD